MMGKRAVTIIKLAVVVLVVCLSGVIRVSAQSVEYYLGRGKAYYKGGEYKKAIPEFKKVVLLDPEDADSYLLLGLAYHLSGNYDEAMIQYQKVVKIDPKHAHAYGNLGYIYGLKGDAEKEREYLRKARRLFVKQGNFMFVNEIDMYLSWLEHERRIYDQLGMERRFEK
jgi:Flp pilus assembly protein TadD